MDALETHDWPGNVRELKNALEHAAVLAQSGPLLPSHLPQHVLKSSSDSLTDNIGHLAREALRETEKESKVFDSLMALWERPLIEHALGVHGGNQMATATFLGISRSTLRKKIAQYGI